MCGPSIVNTDAALAMQVDALQGVYAVQSEALHTALSQDCSDFGKNNFCLAAGGHYGSASHDADAYSALLTGAYRINQNFSIGAYINQVVSSNEGTGINENYNWPLASVFADWNENSGPAGLKTHIAGGYSQSDLTLTRTAGAGLGAAEAGVGSTNLDTYGFSGVVSYGMLNGGWLASPYAGIEYTNITRQGYQETSSVVVPLTFSDMVDGATTVMGGVNVDKKVTEDLTLSGRVGVEYDIARDSGQDAGTGGFFPAGGTATADFGADNRRFRWNGSLGGSFATLPGQNIVAGVTYREESFSGVNTVGVTAAYQVHF